MNFTQVVRQLRSRGIQCECIAWYPWKVKDTPGRELPLGFDSCGIFYIGGCVDVSMPWMLKDVHILTEIAAAIDQKCTQYGQKPLHEYESKNAPGQPWKCYRFRTDTKKKPDKEDLQPQSRIS